jgi:predicted O-linked N-acetylglucosamine transferase (SPINDLY family)
MLLRRLGMPEWLITQNEDDYIATALRLIDNDAERVALSRQAVNLDLDRTLFGDATTPLGRDVVDAMWWVYQHHEEIKASGRKVFRPVDRTPSPA